MATTKHIKDTSYFAHDYNAHDDEKVMELLLQYEWEGYGLYWVLIEMMAQATDNKLKLASIRATARTLNYPADQLEKFIEDCIKTFELFHTDGESYWSNSLHRRLNIREEKRLEKVGAGKKGAETRWKKDSTTMAVPLAENSTAIIENSNVMESNVIENNIKKVKESNVSESNEKEKKGKGWVELSPELKEKIEYTFYLKGIDSSKQIERFFDLNKMNDWNLKESNINEKVEKFINKMNENEKKENEKRNPNRKNPLIKVAYFNEVMVGYTNNLQNRFNTKEIYSWDSCLQIINATNELDKNEKGRIEKWAIENLLPQIDKRNQPLTYEERNDEELLF